MASSIKAVNVTPSKSFSSAVPNRMRLYLRKSVEVYSVKCVVLVLIVISAAVKLEAELLERRKGSELVHV